MQPPSAQTRRMTAPKQLVKESRVDGTYRSDGQGRTLIVHSEFYNLDIIDSSYRVASFFSLQGSKTEAASLGSGQEAASPTMSGLWTTMSGKCMWWYVYGSYRGVGCVCGSYRGVGACMGPSRVLVRTRVVVRVWVLQRCWCVYGSYRGVGACMGPTGVLVRVWVLQGCWCVYGSFRGVGAYKGGGTCMGPTGVLVPHPVRPSPCAPPPCATPTPPARQCMGKCALQECKVGVLYMECMGKCALHGV